MGAIHHVPSASTVLWKSKNIWCTASVTSNDHIEICLSMEGVVVNRAVFAALEPASRYSVQLMHAYDPLRAA